MRKRERTIAVETDDAELERVITAWLADAGYEIVRNSSVASLCIVDTETRPYKEDGALNLVYRKGRRGAELERPFTKMEFMTAVAKNAQSDPRGEISFDDEKRAVRYRGGEVILTKKEYEILRRIADAGDRGVARDEITAIAGSGKKDTNAVDVYICFLRRKLEQLTGRKLIKTLRNFGYVFDGSV